MPTMSAIPRPQRGSEGEGRREESRSKLSSCDGGAISVIRWWVSLTIRPADASDTLLSKRAPSQTSSDLLLMLP
jgi:hypothetical protein